MSPFKCRICGKFIIDLPTAQEHSKQHPLKEESLGMTEEQTKQFREHRWKALPWGQVGDTKCIACNMPWTQFILLVFYKQDASCKADVQLIEQQQLA